MLRTPSALAGILLLAAQPASAQETKAQPAPSVESAACAELDVNSALTELLFQEDLVGKYKLPFMKVATPGGAPYFSPRLPREKEITPKMVRDLNEAIRAHNALQVVLISTAVKTGCPMMQARVQNIKTMTALSTLDVHVGRYVLQDLKKFPPDQAIHYIEKYMLPSVTPQSQQSEPETSPSLVA